MGLHVWNAIASSDRPVCLRVVSAEVLRVTILTTDRLWDIWNNLHAAWDDTCRSTTSRGVSRGSWAPESLSQLLNQGDSNIVGCDMYCVSNTQDNKGSFSRKG